MKPGSYITQKLAAEAAAMEARLTALKLQLQKDKAQREAAAASAVASGQKASIWTNGQQGPLRKCQTAAGGAGQLKDVALASAQPAAGPTRTAPARASSRSSRAQPFQAVPADPTRTGSSSRQPSAARSSAAAAPAQTSIPKAAASSRPGVTCSASRTSSASSTCPTSSTSSSGSLDTRSSDTPTKAAAAKPQWLQQLKQQQQQQQEALRAGQPAPSELTLAGDCVATSSTATAGQDSTQGASLLHGTYDEAAAAGSFQDALRQWRQAAPAGNSSSSSGCEDEQGLGSSLLHGTYDEAAAAGSFQDALWQWRQAAPAGSNHQGSTPSPSSVHASNSGTAAATQCAQQHSSSTNTAASAAAGQAPSTRPVNSSVAAFLQKLTTRSSVASAGGAHTTNRQQLCVEDAAATMPSSMQAGVCPSTQRCTSFPATAVGGMDDAAAGSPDAGQQAPDPDTVHAEAFDAWLQQAACSEHTASVLVDVSAGSGVGQCAAQQSSCDGSATCAGEGPSAAVASADFQQQLDSMLQAVELLEAQLQQRAMPRGL